MAKIYQCPKCGYIESRDTERRKIFGRFYNLPPALTKAITFQTKCEKCGEIIRIKQYPKED